MTSQKNQGIVYLVGAGPGDPGLITVRGARLLEQAEVVVYDYLANPRLLSYCPQAEIIYVGKKAASHTMTQEEINQLLVNKGGEGKRVVRLKGGDPFVFGRGGEECEALRAAGVPFEIVPGITAAIAAPAYAGIPVTHRDFNSSFTLITGHEKEEEYRDDAARNRGAASGSSDLDWPSIAKLPCMAFYMGVKALPRICAKLIENGKPADTPAASIQWGTRPNQRTVVATLATLPQRIVAEKLSSPAITIVGRVVEMRQTINWFETRPLFGQTIVVTRTRQQASALSERLEELGANVLEAPTIELRPTHDMREVDGAISRGGEYDWLIFTSANGVRFTRDRLRELKKDVRVFAKAKVAAIGAETADAIRDELGLHVDLCPNRSVAEALADALAQSGEIAGNRFLMLRAEIARPILRQRLEQSGAAEVRDIAIYETHRPEALPESLVNAIADGQVHWITFTSSSTARNFTELLPAEHRPRLKHIKLASIGPITTATMKELGLKPAIEAEESNVDALIAAICSYQSQ